MAATLYMVIEHFKRGDAVPVYRRFRDQGRMTPEGLTYVSSWVDVTFQRCYQLMETDNRSLLDQWMSNWEDLVDFEVYTVSPFRGGGAQNRPIVVAAPRRRRGDM